MPYCACILKTFKTAYCGFPSVSFETTAAVLGSFAITWTQLDSIYPHPKETSLSVACALRLWLARSDIGPLFVVEATYPESSAINSSFETMSATVRLRIPTAALQA